MDTELILRAYSKYVYIAGAGNYWYEDIYRETRLYKLYQIVSFSIYTTMIFLENVAALFGVFPDVERNSAVMFAAIHNIVLPKMYLMLYYKKDIKKFNYDMAMVGKGFEEEGSMRKQYRRMRVGILLYVVTVYLSLISYGVESARRMVVEDRPFYTVVTYYPTYEDTSHTASFFRVFFYSTWLYMMLPMMSADCFPITHLVAMMYKFITLRHHYERLRKNFDKKMLVNRIEALNDLKAGFLEGVLMHQKLLSLTEELHRIFGIIMSLQVCESSAIAVLLLARLAQSPHLDLTNAFMTYSFVFSLFLLLALNLWNAGEVTYQASLLSNAMFDCGWHVSALQTPSYQDIRRLVLIGSAQAQKPLIMKAFGIQDLSYETFVSVGKMTYSVFAVFYQRGE